MKKTKSLLARFFFWVASVFDVLARWMRQMGSKTSPKPQKDESRHEVRGMKILYPEEDQEKNITDHRGQKQPSYKTETNSFFKVTLDDLDNEAKIDVHPSLSALIGDKEDKEDEEDR